MSDSDKEQKTLVVIILTIITMVAEIVIGYITHSMALFADGCHMGTHALALGITFFTYLLIKKFKFSDKFSFGTGKFGTLAGFTSSILLGITGILIIIESLDRIFNPLNIGFNEAIVVAIIGLLINSLCAYIMGGHNHKHCHKHENEDYNFKAAYMHIIADAMTSVFAIIALFAGKYLGLNILDPIVGLIGGSVICIWAYNLIKGSGSILLDAENQVAKDKIISSLKNKVNFIELHVWNTSEDKVSVVGKYKAITAINIESMIKNIIDTDCVILEKTIS